MGTPKSSLNGSRVASSSNNGSIPGEAESVENIKNSKALHSNAQIMLPTQDPLIMQRLEFHLRLRKVWAYLNESDNEPIRLDTAAQVACMEKTAFSRFFRRATGVRFYDFALSWRIQKALELMTASDQSITEIAYEVGFQNLSSFERSFKKFLSRTPSQHRETLLRNQGLVPQSHEFRDFATCLNKAKNRRMRNNTLVAAPNS